MANANGKVTGVDVENATVVPRLDAQKDPLSLSGSSEIVTLSDIGGKGKDAKIQSGIKLHYQDSEAGTYTLFTTSSPTDCYGLPDFFSPCRSKDKYANTPFSGVTASELQNKIVVRRWTTGVLLVPYKYGLANHSLVSGSITRPPTNTMSYAMFDCPFATLQRHTDKVKKRNAIKNLPGIIYF